MSDVAEAANNPLVLYSSSTVEMNQISEHNNIITLILLSTEQLLCSIDIDNFQIVVT